MHNTIIIRYSEIGLKGKNRHLFEKRLIGNIKAKIKKAKKPVIYKKRGRIYIKSEEKMPFLSHVFGISSYSHALCCKYSIENIKECIGRILKNRKFGSFRITASRIDKSTKETSNELNIALGSYVAEKYKKKVSLKNYDINIYIEVNEKAYVFLDKVQGKNGLPVGITGRVFCLIENKKSISACKAIMSRGCLPVLLIKRKMKTNCLEKYAPGKIEKIKISSKEDILKLKKSKGISSIVLQSTNGAEFFKLKSFLILVPTV